MFDQMLPNGYEFSARYAFKCPDCDKAMEAAPSILMEMGINSGRGTCKGCSLAMHLEIDLSAPEPTMKATRWTDHLEREARPLLAPRPGWQLTPPDDSDTWQPYASPCHPAAGWDMFWTKRGTEDPDKDVGPEIPWPFGKEDIAEPEDFEALGFRVEI